VILQAYHRKLQIQQYPAHNRATIGKKRPGKSRGNIHHERLSPCYIYCDCYTSVIQHTAMSMKKCPTCGETDLAQFGKDKHRPDELATYCKACRAARHTQTYTPAPKKPAKGRDKAKANASSRNWHKNNPDYVTEYMRKWRKDHREAYNAYHRSYPAGPTNPQIHKPTSS